MVTDIPTKHVNATLAQHALVSTTQHGWQLVSMTVVTEIVIVSSPITSSATQERKCQSCMHT